MSRYLTNKIAIEKLEEIRELVTSDVEVQSIDKAIGVLKGQLDIDILEIYPYNLAYSICKAPMVDADVAKIWAKSLSISGIEEGLASLKQREREVLEFRFKHRLSLEKIGRHFNVTRERIRQIEAKALHKLKRPHQVAKMRAYSFNDVVQHREELNALTAENKQIRNALNRKGKKEGKQVEDYLDLEDTKSVSLHDIDFSTRTWNGLVRAGIENLGAIAELSEAELLKVRNIGVKSVKEVKGVLAQYGLELRN